MSRRRRLRLLLLVVIACGGVAQAGDVPAPAAIIAMIDAGQFKAAESAIAAALAREDGDATMRSVLEFQRERMRRIRLDFSLDTDAAKDWLVKTGYDEEYGARPLRRLIQRQVENVLARRVLGGEFADGDLIRVDVDGDALTFERTASPIAAPLPVAA